MKTAKCCLWISALFVSLFFSKVQAQVPSLEGLLTLPTSVAGASSAASDGYGQHLVGVYGTQVKHFLIGNDGAEIAGYSTVVATGGSYPVVTSHAGKLRVTMKAGNNLSLYESVDGGAMWTSVASQDFGVPIFNIDASSDETYGTHIVWGDNSSGDGEVYYVRLNNQTPPTFIGFKNVSDLSGPSVGGRPKVTSSSSEAHVGFVEPQGGQRLVSRDLNLSTGVWEGNYISTEPTWPIRSTNLATIGNTVYAVSASDIIAGPGCLQYILFTSRQTTDNSWAPQSEVACTSIGPEYLRTNMVAGQGVLYVINSYTDGITLHTYTPGIGWGAPETLENPTGEQVVNSLFISASPFGVYGFWEGTSPGFHLHMRRKPHAIIGDISERTLLTGNNWVSTTAPAILSGVTVDALNQSLTTILPNSWFNVYGTLNVNSGATITCDDPAGELIIRGGTVNNNGTINCSGFGACMLVQNYGGNTGRLFIGDDNTQTFTGGAFLAMDGGELSLGSGAGLAINSGSRMEVRQPSTFSFGSSASITVNGTMDVWNNTTFYLPSNSQFFVNTGAQITMGTNTFITTEGKFHAIGTGEAPVVFQGTGGATWQGIRAKSGNFSGILGDIQLNNVTVSNATIPIHLETPLAAYLGNVTLNSPSIGIEILPNYNLWVQPPPPPTMQLIAATINSASGYGITVENFSDLQIGSCVITGNQAIAGLALTGSSPKILESTLQDFELGIWGVSNSAPVLFDEGIGGYNTITSTIAGAQFEGNSHAALGLEEDGIGGQNSFTEYYSYAVALLDGSIVHAELNWWDTRSPTSNTFYVVGDSKIYYEPYLTAPPGGNAPLSGGDDPRLTPGDSRVKQVLRFRVQNRNLEAESLLKSIIADQECSAELKRWSLGQLLAVGQKLRNRNLATYLGTLQSAIPALRQYLDELIPDAHMHEGAVGDAIDSYTSNIRNHGNSITEAQALYGKFTYVLYGLQDRTEAEVLLNALQTRYPLSGQARLAEVQLGATIEASMKSGDPIAKGEHLFSNLTQINVVKPTSFALHPNHPNPFNPTTQIRFDLPEESRVTLVLYDVLGRKVTELASGDYGAGFHSVAWNASSFASGIYLARFTAIDASGAVKLSTTQKLVLTK